ncbi:hypothetical protein S100390_v1c09670 [Spiroplasma sp. NBRC 100390]|uniref:hypothetical protein n=1 Tax=unclassified Spiroplasma TaxID=2637901 RepID=UPI0008929638|nr:MULTISPECIES: hypothetical protein [unclassified Spiroplasma]AOX44303.1 hypothetical protein STU14_v1c09670 [Spiroplasma sp. TU-14]APE13773.1 hypothetical protein S100390_v1c09670 [Spiroplasma sp. NBRC 100390]
MFYLNAQASNIPVPVLIVLVVLFTLLSIASGGWWWWHWRKTRHNKHDDGFTTKQKLTVRAAFQKNKYLILFLCCFFCLIGLILVLVNQLVGFPLF